MIFHGIRTSIAKKPSRSAHMVVMVTTQYYSLNMHVQLSSGARCLNFELHIINVLLCVCKQLKLPGDSALAQAHISLHLYHKLDYVYFLFCLI